jgi:preprotein translocase subunit Sec63
MPTFDEFCKNNRITDDDMKENFKEYIDEGEVISTEEMEDDSDLDEGDLKEELESYKADYPEKFPNEEADDVE